MARARKRTSEYLKDILFDELEALVSGESTPADARAKANVANTICSIARLEMDFAKSTSGGIRTASPKTLKLASK